RRAEWPPGCEMRPRIGLHTGFVVLGETGWTGLAIHEAARIGSAAHGGQVLVSEATKALVPQASPVGYADLGSHRLKDIEEPVRLFQLTHPGIGADFPPPRSIFSRQHNLPSSPTSFVGRETDLRAITELLASSRLVTIAGPGGTGKTRVALQVAGSL